MSSYFNLGIYNLILLLNLRHEERKMKSEIERPKIAVIENYSSYP